MFEFWRSITLICGRMSLWSYNYHDGCGLRIASFLVIDNSLVASQDFNMSILAAYVRPSSNSEIVKVNFGIQSSLNVSSFTFNSEGYAWQFQLILQVNLLASNDYFEKVHLYSRFSHPLHGLGGWCLSTFCMLVKSTKNIVGWSRLWGPSLRNLVQ